MPTAEEKVAYQEEVRLAQEEAEAALVEPVSADIFQSEWDLMLLRRSVEDGNRLFDIVEAHGAPNIVPDPEEPEEEEPTVEPTEE
jgi:hypothetical protein